MRGDSLGSSGTGVFGIASTGAGAKGVWGKSTSGTGVRGESSSTNGIGVYGTSNTGTNARGVLGTSTSGYGVRGESTNGVGTGVYGVANGGTGARGVWGQSANGYGVSGESTGGSGAGVYGDNPNNYGVYGQGYTGVTGVSTAAVAGNGGAFYGGDIGVLGQGPNYGAYGLATGTGVTFGVYGRTSSSAGNAGYFDGNVQVVGTLTKAGGAFRIDHPLDPERRWLSHSFVESPDMKNIYDGVATAGPNGTVTVTLPSYFDALNRTFRYQLTALDGPAPTLHISKRITKRSFRIGGAEPGQEISWMVTGIRQDDYANAHRIKVDTRKTKKERGTRLFVPKGSGARKMDMGPAKPKLHKVAKPRKPKAVKG